MGLFSHIVGIGHAERIEKRFPLDVGPLAQRGVEIRADDVLERLQLSEIAPGVLDSPALGNWMRATCNTRHRLGQFQTVEGTGKRAVNGSTASCPRFVQRVELGDPLVEGGAVGWAHGVRFCPLTSP